MCMYIVQAEHLSLSLKSFCVFEKNDIVADMTICGWVCSPRKGLARAAVLTTLCCNGPSLTLSKAGHCVETIFDIFLQGISKASGLGNPTSPKGERERHISGWWNILSISLYNLVGHLTRGELVMILKAGQLHCGTKVRVQPQPGGQRDHAKLELL